MLAVPARVGRRRFEWFPAAMNAETMVCYAIGAATEVALRFLASAGVGESSRQELGTAA